MAVRIGTSGWQYAHWRGTFYPRELPTAGWLEYYAQRFATVESNSAFYRLPERRTFANWAERSPDGFDFAVKASRYLTHVRRLRDPAEAVTRLAERLEGLGDKCGPVLLQLPPNLPMDLDALESVLRAFPSAQRVAFEPRHPSWNVESTRRLLEARGVAWCLTDVAGRRAPLWRTTHWGYVRFHRGRASPAPCYGRTALSSWADRIRSLWAPSDTVYCFFNNDERACALRDAHRLALAVSRLELLSTRTPGAREVSLGV